mmetsp:Transcript_37804/g.52488  ORF Transcript_37804/g.52488 Transcript_37804/m.52488 type:complete len:180 (-) Transcript_37804:131-670(-)|eukprot:CAMPEP_0196576268 /NCGR_PEP_ID=MMETSP1081-20130531/5566_1 /TAXON_ID=36882 /ORGANISM="Pyramimonas amylifera, Strain CCMP720" /LENGTH=179 /DNA_ID=CAMNT_0041894835 /DNA_START=71 /DNA_END=610 /DNA_ORIENTATION=-
MVACKYHQYQIVGRHVPTEKDASPKIYRMKMWATDAVRAKSKFWYFMSLLKKVKRANGQIISCNEILERKPTTVKNYGVWVRYQSRTGYHNMYKEFRDVTMNGAVDQLYCEMGARHRVRASCLQIVKTATIPSNLCKRTAVTMMHDPKVSFPIQQKIVRPISKSLKTVFKYKRPAACMM